MNTNAIKSIAREPSTAIGMSLIALAVEEFSHGFSPTACIKFVGGVCGVLLRESGAASVPANGTQSTSVEVSASLKKEVTNNGNTNT